VLSRAPYEWNALQLHWVFYQLLKNERLEIAQMLLDPAKQCITNQEVRYTALVSPLIDKFLLKEEWQKALAVIVQHVQDPRSRLTQFSTAFELCMEHEYLSTAEWVLDQLAAHSFTHSTTLNLNRSPTSARIDEVIRQFRQSSAASSSVPFDPHTGIAYLPASSPQQKPPTIEIEKQQLLDRHWRILAISYAANEVPKKARECADKISNFDTRTHCYREIATVEHFGGDYSSLFINEEEPNTATAAAAPLGSSPAPSEESGSEEAAAAQQEHPHADTP
jgi:hypothetical protein